jgi:hypothetical protein
MRNIGNSKVTANYAWAFEAKDPNTSEKCLHVVFCLCSHSLEGSSFILHDEDDSSPIAHSFAIERWLEKDTGRIIRPVNGWYLREGTYHQSIDDFMVCLAMSNRDDSFDGCQYSFWDGTEMLVSDDDEVSASA